MTITFSLTSNEFLLSHQTPSADSLVQEAALKSIAILVRKWMSPSGLCFDPTPFLRFNPPILRLRFQFRLRDCDGMVAICHQIIWSVGINCYRGDAPTYCDIRERLSEGRVDVVSFPVPGSPCLDSSFTLTISAVEAIFLSCGSDTVSIIRRHKDGLLGVGAPGLDRDHQATQ